MTIGKLGKTLSSVMVSAGFPVRAIANSLRCLASQEFTLPDDFKGKCIYITGCGGGGGGGGYITGLYNSRSWGCGGGGAASAFRVPIAAEAGDVIRITVGAAGVAATSSTGSQGSEGGATIIENLSAISEKRFGELTKFIAKILLRGGAKGTGNTLTDKAYVNWTHPAGGKIDGIFDTFVDIGFVIDGGAGGRGGAYYGTSWTGSNKQPESYAYGAGTNGTVVRNIEFDNAKQSDGNNSWEEGGGGGGCFFAGDGFGFGGKGRSKTHAATSGENGFALIEWD